MYSTRPRNDAGPVRLSDPYEANLLQKLQMTLHRQDIEEVLEVFWLRLYQA